MLLSLECVVVTNAAMVASNKGRNGDRSTGKGRWEAKAAKPLVTRL